MKGASINALQKLQVFLVIFGALVTAAIPPAVFSDDRIEIRMSWWGGNRRHQATLAAIELFEKKHPDIQIKAEYTGWTGHLEKLSTQIAGRTEPDLMQINWNWLTIFSKRGNGFVDLKQFDDVIDFSQWEEDILDAGTMGKKLNGLTVSVTGRVFFLNKTTYDEAGTDLPRTWDEMVRAAETFKKQLGKAYFPFDAGKEDAWMIAVLICTQQTGKGFIDPDTSRVAWSREELSKALSFYQNLVARGVMRSLKAVASEGDVALNEQKNWMEGKLAGTYVWDSTYFKFNDPIINGQLVPVPTLMTNGAVCEGIFRKPSMMFAISPHSKHPKEAAMLLNFLLNDDEAIRLLGTTRGIPASKKAENLLKKENRINPQLDMAHKIILESRSPQLSPYFENFKLQDLYSETMEEFSYGMISAQEAADKIIQKANRILKRLAR